jgi:hypothetical protein
VSALPNPAAWRAAAARHDEFFAALDPGARIGLIAREAPATMLLWEAGDAGIEVRAAAFPGFSASGADVLLAADAEALTQICGAADADALAQTFGAADGRLFTVLRACIRSGAVVCYVLRRRCDLEARGFEELLEALGFAFIGACR